MANAPANVNASANFVGSGITGFPGPEMREGLKTLPYWDARAAPTVAPLAIRSIQAI
jgi:hypothetical protein